MALLTSVTDVNACTCIVQADPAFLVESGSVLPANAKGIPIGRGWSGNECAVWRLGEQETLVPCWLSPVDFPRSYDWKQHDSSREDRLWLVCADWEPGSRYRIDMGRQSIDVEVASQPFVSTECAIDIWENGIGDVETMTLHGSCTVRFSAHRVGVEISGDAIDQWRDALLYFTIIDGEIVWRPRKSVCSKMPPGQSWVGPTRELLYWCCEGSGGAYAKLSKGKHSVRMIAWLPGVWQVAATTEVTLGCR